MALMIPVQDGKPVKVISFVQTAALSSSTALTVPKKANGAMIQADGNGIRIVFDASTPTAALGHLIANGDTLTFFGNLSKIRMIQVAATATAMVTFLG